MFINPHSVTPYFEWTLNNKEILIRPIKLRAPLLANSLYRKETTYQVNADISFWWSFEVFNVCMK